MPITIYCGERVDSVPQWALLELRLFDELDHSIDLLLTRYLTPEGEIIWPETVKDFQTFAYSNVDNAFEGFQSWPLYYLLGGDRRFLELAKRQLEVLTNQFSHLKKHNLGIDAALAEASGRDTMLVDGWFPDLDWMHQGEAAMLLYHLCLADPNDEKIRGRLLSITAYLLDENPAGFAGNFDYQHQVFKTSYFGTNGPAYAKYGRPIRYQNWMNFYGLAFYDVPGVKTLLDLADEDKAARYGAVYGQRLRSADTVTNMMATTMVTCAYLYTGEARYRQWVLDYVGGWRRRYAANGGIMPDNAGPDGVTGSTLGGRWYGGHYGWVHPHGFYFIGDALTIGGENERLLTGSSDRLGWLREQLLMLEQYAETSEDGTRLIPQKHTDQGATLEYVGRAGSVMTAPRTISDRADFVTYLQREGWYEYAPACAAHLSHLYCDRYAAEDLRLARRLACPANWEKVTRQAVAAKYKGGQDAAYLNYLAGGYENYPEDVLRHSIDQVRRQLDILKDEMAGGTAGLGYAPDGEAEWRMLRDITKELHERHGLQWSESIVHSYYQTFLLYRNTITTEALVHLTLGGLSPIYNGGMLQASVRYYDADARRPGLPGQVSVLVSHVAAACITLTVCNLDQEKTSSLLVQGGAFGEHVFTQVTSEGKSTTIGDNRFILRLAPGCLQSLEIGLRRHAGRPSLDTPFS